MPLQRRRAEQRTGDIARGPGEYDGRGFAGTEVSHMSFLPLSSSAALSPSGPFLLGVRNLQRGVVGVDLIHSRHA